MMTSEEDSDFRAMQEVHQAVLDALMRVRPEVRQRILQSVETLLGAAPPTGPAQVPRRAEYFTETRENPATSGDFTEDRTISPKAFILDKKPRTDIERVACLSYYLTHYRDMPHFKTIDISKLNTDAAQPKLSNPSYTVENAAKAGYLVPTTKGQKQLSGAGELFVQALPDHVKAKEAMLQALPRRSMRTKATSLKGRKNGK